MRAVVALAQLNAVQTTYKAACRSNGVPVHKPLATQIEDAIQEGSSIDKVTGGRDSLRAASPPGRPSIDKVRGRALFTHRGCAH